MTNTANPQDHSGKDANIGAQIGAKKSAGGLPVLSFDRLFRVSPIPRDFSLYGESIRTLAVTPSASVVTDLDAATSMVRRRVRDLPRMHGLFTSAGGFSLGYRSPYGRHGAELYLIDPDLRPAGSFLPTGLCTGFVLHGEQWIVADCTGTVWSFHQNGMLLWSWLIPFSRSSYFPYTWLAAGGGQIFVCCGVQLYALSPRGQLIWARKLPEPEMKNRGFRQGPTDLTNHRRARQILGLQDQTSPEEVRRAYYRMARLTHPDLHPHNAVASWRFQRVREACETLLGQGNYEADADEMFTLMGPGALRSTATVSANDQYLAVGTSTTEVCLFSHDGKMLSHYTGLGMQGVASVLLGSEGIRAAYCGPRLYCFGNGTPRKSDTIVAWPGKLVEHGDDVLLQGQDALWLVDRHAGIQAVSRLDEPIKRICLSGTETFVLCGKHLCVSKHPLPNRKAASRMLQGATATVREIRGAPGPVNREANPRRQRSC